MNTYQIHYFGLLSERRGLALRIAVNDEMVGWDHPLTNGDHIAFLPPMSGG